VLLTDYQAQAAQLAADARALLDGLDPATRLDDAKGRLNALKDARLAELQGALRALLPEDRRAAGQAFNALKTEIADALDAFETRQRSAAGPEARVDLSMPARARWRGAVHPVTAVIEEICAIFRELGFTVAMGPEAEHAWYNFGALNFPADHPAMEMHDTLYLAGATAGERAAAPHAHVAGAGAHAAGVPPAGARAHPGQRLPPRLLRRDARAGVRAVEGLAVDEGCRSSTSRPRSPSSPALLRRHAARALRARATSRSPSRRRRWTSRSTSATGAARAGSRSSAAAWCTPTVLEAAGVDSERYTGWAFGMGPARIAMSRHDIPDIRLTLRFRRALPGAVRPMSVS
jgi:phenylalanyl-tRNA synthetase alpha chain